MPTLDRSAAVTIGSRPALTVQDACFSYRRTDAILKGVTFSVPSGQMLGVVGPNGSGKTTLLRVLSGVYELSSGRISIHGRPLESFAQGELARQIAVVPQRAEFAFDYSVLEVVALGRIPHLGRLGIETAADREAVSLSLARAGIEHLQHRSIHELSGGELQLVLIARALAQTSSIVLLDEPTSSLDLGHLQQVVALLHRLNQESGLTILLVTHDLNLAARETERILLFSEGILTADGTAAEVLTPEAIRQVYRATVQVLSTPGWPDVPLILPVAESETQLMGSEFVDWRAAPRR